MDAPGVGVAALLLTAVAVAAFGTAVAAML